MAAAVPPAPWALRIEYQNMFMRLNGEPPQERDFSGTENAMRMQMARVKAQIINNAMLSGVSQNPENLDWPAEGLLRDTYMMLREAQRKYTNDLPKGPSKENPVKILRVKAEENFANSKRAIFNTMLAAGTNAVDKAYADYFHGASDATFTLTPPGGGAPIITR